MTPTIIYFDDKNNIFVTVFFPITIKKELQGVRKKRLSNGMRIYLAGKTHSWRNKLWAKIGTFHYKYRFSIFYHNKDNSNIKIFRKIR